MIFDPEFILLSNRRYRAELYNPTLYLILLEEISHIINTHCQIHQLNNLSFLEILPNPDILDHPKFNHKPQIPHINHSQYKQVYIDLSAISVSNKSHEPIEQQNMLISVLNLHKINTINETLKHINQNLVAPGGAFVGTFLSPGNMQDLRNKITKIETLHNLEHFPRFTPGFNIKTAGQLLNKAGFARIVLSQFNFHITFKEGILSALNFLKASQESNSLNSRSKKPMSMSLYNELSKTKNTEVEFQFLTFCCQKP